jgi:anti-anti-sigma regulatory factor
MPLNSDEIARVVVAHLTDILTGECSITREEIEQCGDDRAMCEILSGLLFLHEDLKFREAHVVRVEELQKALNKVEQQNRELEESRAALAALAAELSTPVITLWEGVVMMPIIGRVDAARAASILERLLGSVASSRAKHAVLDITGVKGIDDGLASHFLRIAGAVRLLGAELILAGTRPEVAQAFVAVGADLTAVTSVRDVKAALALCMRDSG